MGHMAATEGVLFWVGFKGRLKLWVWQERLGFEKGRLYQFGIRAVAPGCGGKEDGRKAGSVGGEDG